MRVHFEIKLKISKQKYATFIKRRDFPEFFQKVIKGLIFKGKKYYMG